MLRFIILSFSVLLSGCIFSPPDGPRLSDSAISAVYENKIEITVTEAVDQSGWYRVTGRHTQIYNLKDVDIYDGYKVGDGVMVTFGDKKIRIVNLQDFYSTPQSTEQYQPYITVQQFKEENKSE